MRALPVICPFTVPNDTKILVTDENYNICALNPKKCTLLEIWVKSHPKHKPRLKKLFYLGDSVSPTREWEISAVSRRFSHNLGAECI